MSGWDNASLADDVTIYHSRADDEFVQAKSSVDASTPATIDWLTTPSRSGGPSILAHLFQAWKDLVQRGENPRLLLVTNKPIDPRDPVLTLREGTDGTVARRLRAVTPHSVTGRARADLATHLDVVEEELMRFLDRLGFRFGLLLEDLRADASVRLAAAGFRSDGQALDLGVGLIRGWVTSGKRVLTIEEVRTEIESLGIQAPDPVATVVVQAIDHRPVDGATVVLDWVDRFSGDEARSRRIPRDPDDWNQVFRPELLEAAREVRSSSVRDVHIAGAMRLPTWFAAGNAFGETAGFQVEAFQKGELWGSSGPVGGFDLAINTETTGTNGTDLAIVISVSTDISDDARDQIAQIPAIGAIADVRPSGGVSPTAIANPEQVD